MPSRFIHQNIARPGPKPPIATFTRSYLSPQWSPDGRRVALVEKVFDWEYLDPFGRYFDGESSDVQYCVVIRNSPMAA